MDNPFFTNFLKIDPSKNKVNNSKIKIHEEKNDKEFKNDEFKQENISKNIEGVKIKNDYSINGEKILKKTINNENNGSPVNSIFNNNDMELSSSLKNEEVLKQRQTLNSYFKNTGSVLKDTNKNNDFVNKKEDTGETTTYSQKQTSLDTFLKNNGSTSLILSEEAKKNKNENNVMKNEIEKGLSQNSDEYFYDDDILDDINILDFVDSQDIASKPKSKSTSNNNDNSKYDPNLNDFDDIFIDDINNLDYHGSLIKKNPSDTTKIESIKSLSSNKTSSTIPSVLSPTTTTSIIPTTSPATTIGSLEINPNLNQILSNDTVYDNIMKKHIDNNNYNNNNNNNNNNNSNYNNNNNNNNNNDNNNNGDDDNDDETYKPQDDSTDNHGSVSCCASNFNDDDNDIELLDCIIKEKFNSNFSTFSSDGIPITNVYVQHRQLRSLFEKEKQEKIDDNDKKDEENDVEDKKEKEKNIYPIFEQQKRNSLNKVKSSMKSLPMEFSCGESGSNIEYLIKMNDTLATMAVTLNHQLPQVQEHHQVELKQINHQLSELMEMNRIQIQKQDRIIELLEALVAKK